MDSPVVLPAEEESHDATRKKAGMNSKLDHKDEDIQPQEMRQRVEHGQVSVQSMLSLRQSPMVEDAFLALFAMDETGSFGNQNPGDYKHSVS